MVQLLILKLKTLVKLLNGERKTMVTLKKIDNAEIMYNKTIINA